MRIKHNVNVFASEDTSGTDVLFGQADVTKRRITSGKFSIAASGTENLPFGDVNDVRGVAVWADSDFNVVFNGGVDSLAFKRASVATTAKATLFMEIDTTQVAIANPSSSAVLTGNYVVWGDPTP
jgi:hypothetical protein